MSEQQFTDATIARPVTEQQGQTPLQMEALSQTAQASVSERKSKPDVEKLEQMGVIPHVEWDVEPEQTLTQEQRKEFEKLLRQQGRVQDFLLTYLESANSDHNGSISPASKRSVERQKQLILAEAEKGEFGEASKKAYKDVIFWLESRAIPGRINALNSNDLDVPQNSFSTTNPPTKLRLNAHRRPTEQDVKDLDGITQWFKSGNDKLSHLEAQRQQELVKWIKDKGLPKGWLPEEGADMNKWYANASQLVRAYHDSVASAGVMHYLNQSGEGVIFKEATPPGGKIDPNGLMKEVDLSMPLDWRLSTKEDQAKMEALEKWTEESKKQLAPFLRDLQTLAVNSERLLQWGDEELRGRKAVFDKDNNLVALATADEPLKPGQHVEPANLLVSRYDVENSGGKIIVTQTVQAENSHWYSYQNMVGVDEVGNKITIRREFNPDDYVMVKHGGEIVLKKASELESHKLWERTMYYGGKGLTTALDATMLVTGTIEVAGAYRAIKGAQVATGVLTRLAAREALSESEKMLLRTGTKQFIVNGMRASVGATGFFNGAAWSESPTVDKLHTARGLFIVADITTSTVGASKRVQTFLERQAKISSESLGYTGRMTSAAQALEKFNTGVQVPTLVDMTGELVYQKSIESGSDNAQNAATVAYQGNLLNQEQIEEAKPQNK